MTTFVPKEVQAGLDSARLQSMKSGSRLRLSADGAYHPVLRIWATGFSLDAADAPTLRGFIDLYDGALHLFQCLSTARPIRFALERPYSPNSLLRLIRRP